MAASTCLAILAGFCFHAATLSAQLENAGVGYALIVRAQGYEADTAQTDVVKEYDWRHQPKVCAGQNCVRYHLSCSNDTDRRICDYRIALVGEVASSTLRLNAASTDALGEATREISLWFGSDTPMLPLFSLQMVPNGAPLVPCPADTDPKICNPQ